MLKANFKVWKLMLPKKQFFKLAALRMPHLYFSQNNLDYLQTSCNMFFIKSIRKIYMEKCACQKLIWQLRIVSNESLYYKRTIVFLITHTIMTRENNNTCSKFSCVQNIFLFVLNCFFEVNPLPQSQFSVSFIKI